MALKPGYCTVIEADDLLLDNTDWLALDDDTKTTAISWGRVYIDSTYDLSYEPADDQGFIDALKVANALLAVEYTTNSLFVVSPSGDRILVEKSVKAGSVAVQKKYSSSSEALIDLFPQVTAVLFPYCGRKNSTFTMAQVVRA